MKLVRIEKAFSFAMSRLNLKFESDISLNTNDYFKDCMVQLSQTVDDFKRRVEPRLEMFNQMVEESKGTDNKIDKVVLDIARDFGMRRNFNGFFDDIFGAFYTGSRTFEYMNEEKATVKIDKNEFLHKISGDIIRIVDDKKLEVKSVFSGLTGCDLQSRFDEINVELHFRPKKRK